jgi:hypothetical protein
VMVVINLVQSYNQNSWGHTYAPYEVHLDSFMYKLLPVPESDNYLVHQNFRYCARLET